jgi:hypothetical protein
MWKDYCDLCRKELKRNCVKDRLKAKNTVGELTVGFEIVVEVNGVSNQGAICEECLMKMVKEI